MAIAKHSTTGEVYQYGSIKEYEHIHAGPTKDTIASCGACGRSNYDAIKDHGVVSNGLVLIDVALSSNGFQSNVIKLCPDCIKDLRSKLFPFSA